MAYRTGKLARLLRRGMTLLELLIVLTVVLVLIFVALPTLKPVEVGSLESFARERLRFIYEKERAYFLRNGTYDRFSVLAGSENGGPYLDRRFIGEDYRERGVIFTGPNGFTEKLLLQAQLPDGKRITLDDKGSFRTHQPEEEPAEPVPLLDSEALKLEVPGRTHDATPGADGEAGAAAPPREGGGENEPPPPVRPPGEPSDSPPANAFEET